MPGPVTADARKRQAQRAYEEWSETVLGNPAAYSKLKLERYRKGICQADLAAAAGIHRGSLSLIEAAGRPPKKASTREALAAALSVEVGDLFD